MKSPTSYTRRRNSSSGHPRSTPDRLAYSPSYASSEVSTVKSNSGRNPVAAAARSVAGIFVACFTPPETNNSKSFAESEPHSGSLISFIFLLFRWLFVVENARASFLVSACSESRI
ncbi:hypothetical protein L6164_003910 [Bauhinia variegata]|uniref:Uncharacterized protein n=1 Tax=Bauhinia variegata TaxID=167791 RepID=A0ACB9Q2S3_BAUVA|nr:hypothetical protein L6164_003910 [Bauhinia variegata]